MSSYGQAYDVGDPSSSSAWTRLALPCSYLAAMLLLLLVATGNLPAGPWSSGSSDGMIGFGRPPRRGQELAANVTHHLKGHLAPLLQQLATNANSLAEEKREVANFHAKLDELALERAAVKQRLVEAMAKVGEFDRLIWTKEVGRRKRCERGRKELRHDNIFSNRKCSMLRDTLAPFLSLIQYRWTA